MILTLRRQIETDRSISGELYLDSHRECFTLENRELAIPVGTFPVALEYSPRFGRLLPEIKSIPGRSECKFHVANWPEQLEGCIALGRVRARDAVLGSAAAVNALMVKLIVVRNRREPITLEVIDEYEHDSIAASDISVLANE